MRPGAPSDPSAFCKLNDVGDCQNYGPFLGPYYNTGPNTGSNLGDPKRDHNFDNPPCRIQAAPALRRKQGFGQDAGPLLERDCSRGCIALGLLG